MRKYLVSAVVLAALCGVVQAQAAPLSFGRSDGDLRPTVVTVSRPVSYADLDLTKASDAAELQRRIFNAAATVCRRLDSNSSYSGLEDGKCIQKTTDQAMADISHAIHVATNQ